MSLTCWMAIGPVFVKLGLTKLPSDAEMAAANAESISNKAKLSTNLCSRPSFESRLLLSCSNIYGLTLFQVRYNTEHLCRSIVLFLQLQQDLKNQEGLRSRFIIHCKYPKRCLHWVRATSMTDR